MQSFQCGHFVMLINEERWFDASNGKVEQNDSASTMCSHTQGETGGWQLARSPHLCNLKG